jgi:DnaJ-class molecular chaperone
LRCALALLKDAKFPKISRAYEILSDEEKRSMYDKLGGDGLSVYEQYEKNPEAFGSFFFVFCISFFAEACKLNSMMPADSTTSKLQVHCI